MKYWHLRYASTNSVWIIFVMLKISKSFELPRPSFPFFIVDVDVCVFYS